MISFRSSSVTAGRSLKGIFSIMVENIRAFVRTASPIDRRKTVRERSVPRKDQEELSSPERVIHRGGHEDNIVLARSNAVRSFTEIFSKARREEKRFIARCALLLFRLIRRKMASMWRLATFLSAGELVIIPTIVSKALQVNIPS